MSWVGINPTNTTGVRRYYRTGLSGIGGVVSGVGDSTCSSVDPDTVNALTGYWITNNTYVPGYDLQQIENLCALGATDDQLLNLPYGPGTTAADKQAGYNALYQQLVLNPAAAAQVAGAVKQQQISSAMQNTGSGVVNLPGASSQFVSWFEQNAGTIFVALGVLIIAPALIKKL